MSQAESGLPTDSKIVITGGAGLVGQNLTIRLLERGCTNVHVLDKSSDNIAIAADLHSGAHFVEADLAEPGPWQDILADADVAILLHAQIGGIHPEVFTRNNVTATANILAALPAVTYLVHVSSSVVESAADDDYSRSKAEQEEMVRKSGRAYTVLRPTLMFGWFDRKHLGWLSGFMARVPVFPIPGNGRFVRQPLYVGDFCEIIIASMIRRPNDECYNISGKQKMDYVEIIRLIKSANGSRSLLLHLPYWLFYALLTVYAVFDRDPPFTTAQLQALVIDETYEDIDWESIFGISATPVEQAIHATFTHPVYSKIRLTF
ncbi:MAG: NAD(P)-dependent oxidoreductase [Halioglobus sp.]|nr:NAD(P)-dependent oxidoreductase [Halioglobus sp.]